MISETHFVFVVTSFQNPSNAGTTEPVLFMSWFSSLRGYRYTKPFSIIGEHLDRITFCATLSMYVCIWINQSEGCPGFTVFTMNAYLVCLQDAFPLGEIVIDSSSEGFFVDENAPDELGGGENAFVLNTPTRTFPLLAETAEDKHEWITVLRDVIEKSITSPMSASNGATLTSYSED